MIKTVTLGGGLRAVISTRATGKVRLAIEHEHHEAARADVDPWIAGDIAKALLECGTAALAHGIYAGEGAQVVPPHRSQGGYVNVPWLAVLACGVWVACVGVSWLVG